MVISIGLLLMPFLRDLLRKEAGRRPIHEPEAKRPWSWGSWAWTPMSSATRSWPTPWRTPGSKSSTSGSSPPRRISSAPPSNRRQTQSWWAPSAATGKWNAAISGENCVEAGIGNIHLVVGGNLVIGRQPWDEVEKGFLEMGFNRVYPPGVSPKKVIEDLKERPEKPRGAGSREPGVELRGLFPLCLT